MSDVDTGFTGDVLVEPTPIRRLPLILLGAFFLLPGVQTALAVWLGWHTEVTYPALKMLMIAVMLVVWLVRRRSGERWGELLALRPTRLVWGVVIGLAMVAAMLGTYYGGLHRGIDGSHVVAKLKALKMLDHYLAMALVVSLGNALFEELYWRAFLVGELRRWTRKTWLVIFIGGALFGVHHVFALWHIMGGLVLVWCVFSTMLAGGVWAWMRLRGVSIVDCYVSHVMADLAIMWIGHDLVMRAM